MNITFIKKSRDRGGCDHFYGKSDGCFRYHTHGEIYSLMRSGHEIELKECSESDELLKIIHTCETPRATNMPIDRKAKGDVKLMNRIIINGGLIEYANKLEESYERRV